MIYEEYPVFTDEVAKSNRRKIEHTGSPFSYFVSSKLAYVAKILHLNFLFKKPNQTGNKDYSLLQYKLQIPSLQMFSTSVPSVFLVLRSTAASRHFLSASNFISAKEALLPPSSTSPALLRLTATSFNPFPSTSQPCLLLSN